MFRLWDLDEDTGFRGSEVTEAQFWRKDEAISPAELEYGIKKARLNNCVLRKQVLMSCGALQSVMETSVGQTIRVLRDHLLLVCALLCRPSRKPERRTWNVRVVCLVAVKLGSRR